MSRRLQHVALAATIAVSSLTLLGARDGGALGGGTPVVPVAYLTPHSNVAWWVNLPVGGDLLVNVSGAAVGDGSFLFFNSRTQPLGGFTDFPNWHAQFSAPGVRLSEGLDPLGLNYIDSGIVGLPPGDYEVVFGLGGSTVSPGMAAAAITSPVGATVEQFATGRTTQLTDSDFNGSVVDASVAANETVDGSVSVTVHHHLFGFFQSTRSSAQLAYTDPSGVVHSGQPFYQWSGFSPGLFGFGGPGKYTLSLRDTVNLGPQLNPDETIAILADVNL